MVKLKFENLKSDGEIQALKLVRKQLTEKEYMNRLDHLLPQIIQDVKVAVKYS